MEKEYINTELIFDDSWDLALQEKYVFQFFHQKLAELEENQINIHGVKLYKTEKGMIVTCILRHTLSKNIQFDQISLVVKNMDGKELATKSFDMESFGELAPYTARPWRFDFEDEYVKVSLEEIVDQMNFELLFNLSGN